LTAPAASPSTKCRYSKRKKIPVGTVATPEAAITTPPSLIYCPRKFATPTGRVFLSVWVIKSCILPGTQFLCPYMFASCLHYGKFWQYLKKDVATDYLYDGV